MEILLSGSDWKLEGFLPNGQIFNNESGINFKIWPIIQEIPAQVPGSVHEDLLRAGLIEDPYYAFNSLKCEWVENKEWRYFKHFSLAKEQMRRHADLILEGLNFEARVYLNGKLLGVHKNVNTACVFSVDGLLKEENDIEVLLKAIPYDEAQMGRTSESVLQGQRFGYGWDFCTRLVGVGVWKDVKLVCYDATRPEEVRIETDYDGRGKISVSGKLKRKYGGEISASVLQGGKTVAEQTVKAQGSEFSLQFCIGNPKLWYPAGYGEQPLYEIVLRLVRKGKTEWEERHKTGIRRLEYELCEGAPEEAIRYVVKINGEKIYLRGINFLPIDHKIGAVSDARYRNQLETVRRGNYNLIRLWGGGIKEKEILFELCDAMGILVWQDFTQSNSGLDGIPCKKREFLAEFKKSTKEIIKSDRNHVCTVIYCGGNELKDKDRNPISYADSNIAMLQQLVRELDPQRIFHPSCPSGPNFNFQTDERSKKEKRNHNIHGQWAYMGKEFHYGYYNQGDYMYHGEFGVNGCSDEESLARFMPAEYMEGYKTSDALWTFRNFTWWNSYYREKDIFGEEGVRNIRRYVPASQLIQAEGLRYIIERNRNRAFACCGNNIWQFGEPWPNPNCGNVVDYYMRPKQAYYVVKNSNKEINVNLRYEKLYYTEGESFSFPVCVSNLGKETSLKVTAQIRTADRVIEEREAEVLSPLGTVEAMRLSGTIACKAGEIFFVRLFAQAGGETAAENLYIFGTSAEAPYAPLFDLCGELCAEVSAEGENKIVMLTNVGKQPVLFAEVYAKDSTDLYFDDNFVTLFAGESRTLRVSGAADRKLYVKEFTRTIDKEIE